jgi:hypothetical protein
LYSLLPVAHTCILIQEDWEAEIRRILSQSQPWANSSKITTQNRLVASWSPEFRSQPPPHHQKQVLQCLLSMKARKLAFWGGVWDQTQGLTHARQIYYHWVGPSAQLLSFYKCILFTYLFIYWQHWGLNSGCFYCLRHSTRPSTFYFSN